MLRTKQSSEHSLVAESLGFFARIDVLASFLTISLLLLLLCVAAAAATAAASCAAAVGASAITAAVADCVF